MVGYRDHDHGRIRRHGAQNLYGHVRRRIVRVGRRADHRASRSRHRVQLLHVLFAHAGLTPFFYFFLFLSNKVVRTMRNLEN